VLFWKGGGLPVGALVGNLVWASLTLGIAAAGIRFALRTSSSRRREYRFPLPIPLRIHTPRGLSLGLATDISPQGCRIVGAPVSGARGGDELQGELLLPTGPLPVRAVVRTVLADSDKAIPAALGCEFRWGLSDERNQLEMFLFGSDLQWRLNGFEDRVRTPLERVGDYLRGERPSRRRLGGESWSPVLYRRVNSDLESGIGFISASGRDGATRTLVSLGVLPDKSRLFAEEVTPAGPRGVVGRVADEQVLETHAAPIYLYKLTA
jgi:cellulose synthase (UDP-forming)